MLRSMYSGVAGLKTHQTKMDVIGNNIANVNTTSYKSQSISFSDLMYQTTQSASGATETRGGVNARQIGLGAQSAAIATAIDTQGATQTTNNPFDLMISGDAFFVVNNGTQNMYTRDGSFYVDGQGNLATQSDGYYVMGWMATTDEDTGVTSVNTNGGLSKLQIMSDTTKTYPPEGTSQAVFTGNIDAKDSNVTSSAGKTLALEFYDNKGYLYTAEFTIKDTDVDNTYTIQLSDILNSDGESIGAAQLANVTFGENTSDTSNNKDKTGTLKSGVYATYSASGGTVSFSSTSYNSETYSYDSTSITSTDTDGNTVTTIAATKGDTTNTTGVTVDQATVDILNSAYNGTFALNDSGYLTLDGDTVCYYSIDDSGNLTYTTTDGSDSSNNVTTSTNRSTVTAVFDPATGDISNFASGKTQPVLNFDPDVDSNDALAWTDITVDMTTLTNVNSSGTSTVQASKGDLSKNNTGRMMGTMTGLTISTNGEIHATYSNGQTLLLAQIASAEFSNASGLQKEGNNLYSSTLNSGDPTIQDITVDGGSISTGVLEMSNVDLSNEFTNMITAQRGFQANSRIITVSDTLLEELTNLKR